MSGASKYFYRAIDPYTCAELLHFHGATSCWEATVWNLTQTIAGCCKYVLPIAIVSAAENTSALRAQTLLKYRVSNCV